MRGSVTGPDDLLGWLTTAAPPFVLDRSRIAYGDLYVAYDPAPDPTQYQKIRRRVLECFFDTPSGIAAIRHWGVFGAISHTLIAPTWLPPVMAIPSWVTGALLALERRDPTKFNRLLTPDPQEDQ